MVIERLPEVLKLSPEEKWLLVDELWTSLLTRQDGDPADPAIIADLENRMAQYEAHPEAATNWESIRERLLSQQ